VNGADATVGDVIAAMATQLVHHVYVRGEDGSPVMIATPIDILRLVGSLMPLGVDEKKEDGADYASAVKAGVRASA
jgi:hypothetical protein